MNKPKIKVFINNNPKCIASIESTAKKEIFKIKNTPYVELTINSIENGNRKLLIESDQKQIYNSNIEIKDNFYKIKLDQDFPLDNTDEIVVQIDNEKHLIELDIKKIYGSVNYHNGNPVEYPILNITGKNIAVVGDVDGNYEISVCGKENQIGVFDKGYSKETLEAWIYNVDFNADTKLNIQIDKMELYRISMWNGETSDYVHFIPMSLSRYKKAAEQGFKTEIDLLKYEGVWPKLQRENVKVSSQSNSIKILSFQEVEDYLVEVDNVTYSRPSYVMSIPKGHSNSVIKLEIESFFETENGSIHEKGEGFYFWK